MASKVTIATWVKQELFYFCGPAVAQMVLQSLGGAAATQGKLWDEVMAASTGTPHNGSGRLPGFAKQHCLQCPSPSPTWRCWYSAPRALLSVINARTPGKALQLLKVTGTGQKGAVSLMVKSIDNSVAAAFVTSSNHWCVVWAYEFGASTPDFPAVPLGGVQVTGFYVHDSDGDPDMSLKLRPVSTFLLDFVKVKCGPAVSGKHVAIVA